jgi:hypothetical protein
MLIAAVIREFAKLFIRAVIQSGIGIVRQRTGDTKSHGCKQEECNAWRKKDQYFFTVHKRVQTSGVETHAGECVLA